MQSPVAVLCASGLAVEAKIARAAGLSVLVGAGDRSRTRRLVETAAAQTNCLVSFGIAGGLAPELKAGTVVVSGQVVSEAGRWGVQPHYRARLSQFARAIGAVEGPTFGASSILATQTEKRRVWKATGALLADLESDIIAGVATSLGIPFIVLRSIADTARRDLPPAALIPMALDGTPHLLRVAGDLLRRPFQLPELARLAHETRAALSALIGPARALRGFVGTA